MRNLIEMVEPKAHGAVGTLTREIPALFLHYTRDHDSIISILRNGFDISRFGWAAKALGAPQVAKYDPVGVFATDLDWAGEPDRFRHWIIFKVKGAATALVSRFNIFPDLSEAEGCVGQELSAKLLEKGVQIVRSANEWVILDPSLIEIVDWRGKDSELDGRNMGDFDWQEIDKA